MTADRLPTRAEVQLEDTWNLASLFDTVAAWETAFVEWEQDALNETWTMPTTDALYA